MKKQTGIWIDTAHAYIIDLTDEAPVVLSIDSEIETRERFSGEGKQFTRVGNVYIDPEKHQERRFDQDLDEYLDKVSAAVMDADELVIFGPAQTKIRLEKKLKENKALADKVLATEAADKMSTNQMVAWVKNFYHHN